MICRQRPPTHTTNNDTKMIITGLKRQTIQIKVQILHKKIKSLTFAVTGFHTKIARSRTKFHLFTGEFISSREKTHPWVRNELLTREDQEIFLFLRARSGYLPCEKTHWRVWRNIGSFFFTWEENDFAWERIVLREDRLTLTKTC